jgi:hypothetical protein
MTTRFGALRYIWHLTMVLPIVGHYWRSTGAWHKATNRYCKTPTHTTFFLRGSHPSGAAIFVYEKPWMYIITRIHMTLPALTAGQWG